MTEASVGERNGYAKLTDDQVFEIHDLAWDGRYSQRKIGRMFDVAQSVVSQIKNEVAWRHLWQRPKWSAPAITEVEKVGA
jgi:hypothetical protein